MWCFIVHGVTSTRNFMLCILFYFFVNFISIEKRKYVAWYQWMISFTHHYVLFLYEGPPLKLTFSASYSAIVTGHHVIAYLNIVVIIYVHILKCMYECIIYICMCRLIVWKYVVSLQIFLLSVIVEMYYFLVPLCDGAQVLFVQKCVNIHANNWPYGILRNLSSSFVEDLFLNVIKKRT